MALGYSARTTLGRTFAVGLSMAAITIAVTAQEAPRPPLALASGRLSIAGTSNIHEYTASTTTLRVTHVKLASGLAGPGFWEGVLKPGAIEAFEIAIPAATLSSPKEGLDKNMHKALNVTVHPDITFRLSRLESGTAPGAVRATGILKIAGVERTITLDLKVQQNESSLTVKGEAQLLMTDFGITPPKAMLGMLKTDPEVTVTFETVLAIPLT
jgi:YceI-like domain